MKLDLQSVCAELKTNFDGKTGFDVFSGELFWLKLFHRKTLSFLWQLNMMCDFLNIIIIIFFFN